MIGRIMNVTFAALMPLVFIAVAWAVLAIGDREREQAHEAGQTASHAA
ncbi:hypothetical protein ABGB18_15620 [Nonomuraea sp. B12E4]